MEPINLTWWTWLIAGLLLMAAELLLPTGFFLFFFGVGAIATSLLAAVGILTSFVPQGVTFTAISILCVALFRKPFLAKFHFGGKMPVVDSMAGEWAQSIEEIAPGETGRVEMRGTTWSARNAGDSAIAPNTRCRVEKVHGLTLDVRS